MLPWMSAKPVSDRLKSAQTTTRLYRSCMNLSEEARSLSVHNEGMKRLGLNAQVLAAQTGEQGGALEVIVAEIGRLSVGIREILEALGESARFLSNASVDVLHLSHLSGSLAQGWNVGIHPGSADRYRSHLDGILERRREHMARLDGRLDAVASLIADLARIAQQIPPVVTMIRIVVTEVRIRSEELLGTVEDLKSFHVQLDAKIESMGRIRAAGTRLIQELGKEAA